MFNFIVFGERNNFCDVKSIFNQTFGSFSTRETKTKLKLWWFCTKLCQRTRQQQLSHVHRQSLCTTIVWNGVQTCEVLVVRFLIDRTSTKSRIKSWKFNENRNEQKVKKLFVSVSSEEWIMKTKTKWTWRTEKRKKLMKFVTKVSFWHLRQASNPLRLFRHFNESIVCVTLFLRKQNTSDRSRESQHNLILLRFRFLGLNFKSNYNCDCIDVSKCERQRHVNDKCERHRRQVVSKAYEHWLSYVEISFNIYPSFLYTALFHTRTKGNSI